MNTHPSMPENQGGKANPTLVELKMMQRELAKIKEEVSGLRADLNGKKPLNVTDQVAKGVVIAGFFWIVTYQILAGLVGVIFGR